MPDRRSHRGPHPEDQRLFAAEACPVLRLATAELSWLLSRGYAPRSSLKLVGDRHGLVARQRIAVGRCACGDDDMARRLASRITLDAVRGRPVWLDGYNVLTTIEAALAGGVVLAARDGTYRDMASMHGSFRKVLETGPALELVGQTLAEAGAAGCRWYLDRPVSNSGRLKQLIEQTAVRRGWPWQVELVADPDAVLARPDLSDSTVAEGAEGSVGPPVVATADSAILDRCRGWLNLARETVDRHIRRPWTVDLAVG